MMVRPPSQIMKGLLLLYFPSTMKAYNIYSKRCIVTMIHFGNMHNGLIILKVSIHASQMLNILLNGTPTV